MARICFLTFGDMEKIPTAKRATGMASALKRLGHEVAIVANDLPVNRKRLELECPDVPPLWSKWSNAVSDIAARIQLVRGWRPTLIYQTSFSLRNLAGMRHLFARNAHLVVEHCELYSSLPGLRHQVVFKLREEISTREADGLVCASNYLKTHFDRMLGDSCRQKPTVYLPYAYPDYLSQKTRSPTKSRAPKHVLFMAALWKNYGVIDVIRAVGMLAKRRSDFVVDILGNGPARSEAETLIRNNGLASRVFLHGFVPEEELNDWFSLSDVFLAPLYDTVQDKARCPSKVYYYLPYQKPIVTCAFGDPYDLLKSDGFYYRPACVENLADVLSRALDESDCFVYRTVVVTDHSWCHRALEFWKWCETNLLENSTSAR